MSQQINLFNPLFLKQEKIFTAVAMAQALAVLAAGTVLVSYMASSSVASLKKRAVDGEQRVARLQAGLEKATTELAPRQKDAQLDTRIEQADARLKSLKEVSHMLEGGELGNTSGYSGYFKAFARQNMHGLWLTGVSIEGAGNEVGVRGRALDATLVPAYIGRLTRETIMHGKGFGSLSISQPELAKPGARDGAPAPAPYVEFSLQSGAREVGE